MRKGVLLGAAVILVVVGGRQGFGQAAARDLARARGTKLRDLLKTAQGVDEEPARTFRTPDGYVRFLSAPAAAHFSVAAGTPEQQAGAFIGRWRNVFVNESAAVAFEQKRAKTANGRTYIRYRQTYSGLEVFGAEMIIQVGDVGGVEAVISDIMRDTDTLDTGKLVINPTIDASTAQQKAIDFMAAQYENLQFEATPATLMIYSPVVVGNSGPPRLVWRTEIGNVGDLVAKELMLVDGHSGEIAFHYSLICSNMTRTITDFRDNYELPPLTYIEDRNEWPTEPEVDVEVELAYEYLEDTYNFYAFHHSRDSWSDYGTPLLAEVRHPGLSYGATWQNGTIGVGTDSVTDDTFGHEFTHGVIQTEYEMIYEGEAGAIQESLCDMWGEWIDLENGVARSGYDNPDDRWKLWEDDLNNPIPLPRNMKNPPECNCATFETWNCTQQHPDYYERPGYWVTLVSADHFIHHNCGVGNKLAYLLCDGTSGEPTGEFNTYTITGLGIPDTAALFYECVCYWLPACADYHDLANVLLRAATNLRMTADEQADVENACRAVQIYSDNSVFSIQDSAGVRVAWFDDVGNLYLAGRAFQNGQAVAMEAHWKLDETTGSTAADSVGSNNGTLYNFAPGDPKWVTGQIDGALEFDGTNDYVSLSAIDVLKEDNVTVSAWIKPDSTAGYDPIVTQYEYYTYDGYDLCLLDGKPCFCLKEYYYAQANGAINSDWHHVAGTYDGQYLRIYVDGLWKGERGLSSSGEATPAYIGRGYGYKGSGYFDGRIDDVRVYDYALNRKEVRYLPSLDPDEVVFRIKNSSDETVARFDSYGYLFLKGSHQTTWADPLPENDNFIITDASGYPVAYIDDSGNLYLTGKLYDEEEQTEE